MTETETVDTEPVAAADAADAPAVPDAAPASTAIEVFQAPAAHHDVGRQLDGEALWAGLKDAALVVVAVFLGVVLIGYKAHQSSTGGGAGAATGTIDVSLTEFAIGGNFNAPVGDVTFNITNDGSLNHDLVVTGLAKTAQIAAGGTDTLVLANLTPGTYEIFCDLPGHKASGMVTTLKVSYS